jgi:hypothetical protein
VTGVQTCALPISRLPNIDLAALAWDTVYTWCPLSQAVHDRPEQTG